MPEVADCAVNLQAKVSYPPRGVLTLIVSVKEGMYLHISHIVWVFLFELKFSFTFYFFFFFVIGSLLGRVKSFLRLVPRLSLSLILFYWEGGLNGCSFNWNCKFGMGK